MKFLLEMYEDMEKLEYEDLPITVYGRQTDVDSWDEKTIRISWTYRIDKERVKEALWNNLMYTLPEYEHLDTDEKIDKYLDEHYEDLRDFYMEQLLDGFRNEAIEDAEENYQDD